jgi:membrane protease YdiL (CAAX protease family)
MSDARVGTAIGAEPAIEAAINCGFYFIVFLAAVALNGIFPYQTALTCVLVTLPYLMILGFILYRRSAGRPWFPIGDAGDALSRSIVIGGILALVAFMFAYNNRLFRPLSVVGALNHAGLIVGAPLAEEFVFRGALLSSLSRTPLGVAYVWKVPVSAMAGAATFGIVRCMIYLAAGVGFADALTGSVAALLASLVYGVIYLRTQNVWYGVFLHTLVNFGQWG